MLTDRNQVIYGLWNTTAGGDSTLSTLGLGNGNYGTSQSPDKAFDRNSTTKYTSYGACNSSSAPSLARSVCGTDTGVFLTLQRGPSLLTAIRFCAAGSLPERDPMRITIEGSNQPSSALLLSSSWTLTYNGSNGFDSDPGRSSFGVTQILLNNAVSYHSYRLLVTSIRNISNAVQYSEIELIGY